MNDDIQLPKSTQEVLDEIAPARQAYAALWAGLSEEEMTRRPGPQEDWSVKDQIAHITWWETYIINLATLIVADAALPKITDYDALNARVVAQNADLPLDFVLDSFAQNWVRLQALLNSLPIDDLMKNDGSAWGWILTDTVDHYEEHTPDLQRYVESLKA